MWNRVHQRLLQESLRRVLRTTACALVRIRHAMQRGVLLIALAGFVMSNNTAPGPGQQSTQSPDQETLPLGWSQLTAYLSQVILQLLKYICVRALLQPRNKTGL